MHAMNGCPGCTHGIACDPTVSAVLEVDAEGRVASFNVAAGMVFEGIASGDPVWSLLGQAPSMSWVLQSIQDAHGRIRLRLSRPGDGRADLFAAATTGIVARGITHDLNNLFTCILATATAAPLAGAEVDRRMAAIRNAVLQGAELLNLLRELSSGPGDVTCDVHEAIEWSSLLLERVGAKVGVEVRAVPADARLGFAAHELQQILINLGLNAIDAMADGGGRLEITARVEGRSLRLVVADTGPGIAPDRLPTVFAPGISTKRGHSGVGLAVVHEIVARAGGALGVESAVGAGTRFIIELPLVEGAP